jgi:hypothetical protein
VLGVQVMALGTAAARGRPARITNRRGGTVDGGTQRSFGERVGGRGDGGESIAPRGPTTAIETVGRERVRRNSNG